MSGAGWWCWWRRWTFRNVLVVPVDVSFVLVVVPVDFSFVFVVPVDFSFVLVLLSGLLL